MHLARIVPALDKEHGVQKAQGTQVFVGDVKLDGVFAITLQCEAGGIWEATIKCHVEPPAEVLAAAAISVVTPERWYSRVLRWITGKPRDVTHLESWAREWEH